MVTSTSATPPAAIWNNAGTKPRATTSMDVEHACTGLALFADMAKVAGKDLIVSSSVKMGYNLKVPSLLGADCLVSFGSSQSYAIRPVDLVHSDHPSKALMFATKPVAG